MNELIKSGLRKDSVVLEVGCGVGTLTVLLNKFLSKGKLVATDISDESIEKAKKRIPNSNKIDFFVTDMKDFSYSQKFDFIVLPDVLEHIPIDQHKELFSCFDPILIFSTYSGSSTNNWGETATYDDLGHLYAGS